jgi:hypothetical protein
MIVNLTQHLATPEQIAQMEEIKNHIASDIIRALPEYDQAKWA